MTAPYNSNRPVQRPERPRVVAAERSRETGCDACPIGPDRRAFLQHAAHAAGAVFAVLGLPSGTARALSVASTTVTRALRAQGTEMTYSIPDKDGVQIDKDNGVILVRWLGSIYAFSLSCPHQNTALRWLDKDEHFQCPKHRSEYAADGYFISGRATRGMDRYAISRDTAGKNVIVDLAVLTKESDDEDKWKRAAVAV